MNKAFYREDGSGGVKNSKGKIIGNFPAPKKPKKLNVLKKFHASKVMNTQRFPHEIEHDPYLRALHKIQKIGQDSSPVPMCTKMRTERPETYPERFPVPVGKINWSQYYPDYNPPYHEGKGVPPRKKTGTKKSHHHPYEVKTDSDGNPLNPGGRTGIKGRGDLWDWGPNHAADPILTRENDGVVEILLIRREDNNQYALPGGMVDSTDKDSLGAASRELQEESGVAGVTFDPSNIVYKGIVDDRRNTDNAWIETVAAWKHYPKNSGNAIIPKAGSDAKTAMWVPLNEEILPKLYASHGNFVKEVMKKLFK